MLYLQCSLWRESFHNCSPLEIDKARKIWDFVAELKRTWNISIMYINLKVGACKAPSVFIQNPLEATNVQTRFAGNPQEIGRKRACTLLPQIYWDFFLAAWNLIYITRAHLR